MHACFITLIIYVDVVSMSIYKGVAYIINLYLNRIHRVDAAADEYNVH